MILADTHVALWLALDETRISRRARAVIEEARRSGEGVALSAISLWEITVAEAKARVKLKSSLETFLAAIEEKFVVLAITGRICALTRKLPASYPKDPADRIIAATAQDHGLPLLTADAEIHRSRAVRAVW